MLIYIKHFKRHIDMKNKIVFLIIILSLTVFSSLTLGGGRATAIPINPIIGTVEPPISSDYPFIFLYIEIEKDA